MDDTMKVEKADIEDIDSLVELRLDYLIEDKASCKLLDDIYSEMISGQNGRRLVLITADDDVTAFFRGRDVMMNSRAEYSYLHPGSATAIGTDKFRIEPIDTDNISK